MTDNVSTTSRNFLIRLLSLLATGAVIGWIYGHFERGLLIAALIALAWHVRHLLAFLSALGTRDFGAFRVGDGVWQQIFAQFSYRDQRALGHKQRYRRLLKEIRKSTDAMPDGAVILSAENEILMCNKAANLLAGLKRKKDRGQRVDNILRDPALTRLLKSGDHKKSIEIPSPVQDDHWLNCRVVPYGADQKLLLLRDVTESIRLSRLRRDFVANASHELRSPLTVISGYLDGLADDRRMPADWVQPLAEMHSQAQRMNQVITELLELSRLESAGPAAKDETVDVPGLLASAKKGFYQPGKTAAIEVLVESTARLLGSGAEIESVIENLVANAVRHTAADGRITLSWRADANGAELCVADTGEGIASEHLPRLTERFYRIDSGRARTDGGVGLGLAIVKHVLDRHDGMLAVGSELGQGSTFCCRFPPGRIEIDPSTPLEKVRAHS